MHKHLALKGRSTGGALGTRVFRRLAAGLYRRRARTGFATAGAGALLGSPERQKFLSRMIEKRRGPFQCRTFGLRSLVTVDGIFFRGRSERGRDPWLPVQNSIPDLISTRFVSTTPA